MHARWRSPPTGIVVIVLTLAAVAVATALRLWGTRWTVAQAPSLDARYSLQAAWDGNAIPGGKLERPIGIAVAPSGDVYVTDGQLRVVRFDPAGHFLGQWGREGNASGEFRNPVGIAVGRDGAVFVSDYEQDRVQKFTSAGGFLLEIGRSGSGPGELDAPAGLATDDAGSLYVADFYNHRVQKWQGDGSFRTVIGHAGRVGPGALHYPTGVAVTAQRELVVADAYNHQLQWFDLGGQALRRVGYHMFWVWPRPVSSTTGFFAPTHVAIGRSGVIHVADGGNHRVVMLSSDGEYVAEWRIPDAEPNVYSPEHIAVSPDGSTVFATDLAGSRVLVLTVSSGS